jgi:hypothetical protein
MRPKGEVVNRSSECQPLTNTIKARHKIISTLAANEERKKKLGEKRWKAIRKQLIDKFRERNTRKPTMKAETKESSAPTQVAVLPRSVVIARKGIRNSRDFANMMSGLLSDIVEGKIAPSVANAACNAGSKLLKVSEMEYKYGQTSQETGEKSFLLVGPEQ